MPIVSTNNRPYCSRPICPPPYQNPLWKTLIGAGVRLLFFTIFHNTNSYINPLFKQAPKRPKAKSKGRMVGTVERGFSKFIFICKNHVCVIRCRKRFHFSMILNIKKTSNLKWTHVKLISKMSKTIKRLLKTVKNS